MRAVVITAAVSLCLVLGLVLSAAEGAPFGVRPAFLFAVVLAMNAMTVQWTRHQGYRLLRLPPFERPGVIEATAPSLRGHAVTGVLLI